MNQSSSTSSRHSPSLLEVFRAVAVIILIFISVVFFYSNRKANITEETVCNRLRGEIHYLSQNDDSIMDFPSLEGATVVRRVYEGNRDFGMCTIRMRLADGTENLYTRIVSRSEPITLQEQDPNEKREPNPFGPYDRHFFFLEVLEGEYDGQ